MSSSGITALRYCPGTIASETGGHEAERKSAGEREHRCPIRHAVVLPIESCGFVEYVSDITLSERWRRS
jgi:hypothetical protein